MGIADDMKRITENIIDSHDARIKGETDRLENFKSMMGSIQTHVREKLEEFRGAHAEMSEQLRGRLQEFHAAHAEMSEQQKKDLAHSETARMEKFGVMMGDIRNGVKTLLSGYSSEMAKTKAVWQEMVASLAKSGKGGEKVAVVAGAVEKKSHTTGGKKGK